MCSVYININNFFNIIHMNELELNIEEINKALESDLTTDVALNILINAANECYNSEKFTDLDRVLISKSLRCFGEKIKNNEDIIIKIKQK